MLPGFDLDGGGSGGSFFLCTETWPRCFVNDIDGALKEVQQSEKDDKSPNCGENLLAPTQNHSNNSSSTSPFLPMLPWWFTAECRHQLLSVPGPEQFRANTPERPPSSICGGISMSEDQLRARLTKQLEFYFSRENLINDRYLRCQMDADQYVPIKIVANFPKVAQLSTDLNLIIDVLKSSSQVQVDEGGTKVRPMSKRCTIILREIPQNADENEVKSMFKSEDGSCPPYLSLAYGLNDSWYVTFQTEEETQQAFFHLQTLGKTFNGKPVFARIKNGGAPIGADLRHNPDVHQHLHFSETGLNGQLIIHEFDIERSTTPNSQYLRPCEKGEDLLTNNHSNEHLEEMRKRKTSASSTATNNNSNMVTSTSPAPFNLGQILAKFGYVPRATFRPNIPAPNTSVLPPLQPTTTGIGALMNGLPQPTSYFTQPILRNDCFIQNIISQQFDLLLQQQHEFEPFFFQNSHYQNEKFATNNFEQNDEFCNENSSEDDDDDDKNENETLSLQSSLSVGQNENIIRQQAKESGVEVSPVLIPSSIPRITDVPRINGKGASSLPNGQVAASAISNTRRVSSPPPQTPGGGFKGFQRQESVEAYQLAMATNEFNKKKRLQVDEKIDGKVNVDTDARFLFLDLIINFLRQQKSVRAYSTEQLPQLFNSKNDSRRSEPPPSLYNKACIQQLFPLSEATVSLNWRQNEVKLSKQQKQSVDMRTVQQQQQWKPHNLSQQQHPSTLITRNVQPLLSLGQALNSMGMSQQPYSFNQIGQLQSRGKIFDRNKSSYGHSGGFKGASFPTSYRSRTWTTNNNDWQGKQQNNEYSPSVIRFQNDLVQWQGLNKNPSGTRKRWAGGENTSGVGIKNLMRRNGSEYNNNNIDNNNIPTFVPMTSNFQQQQKYNIQLQKNKLFQQQQENNRVQPQRKVRPPFVASRRDSNRQASNRFPTELKENEPFINNQQSLRSEGQLTTNEEQKLEHQSNGYNFEEHVEEFPALNLSQLNSRKASECHSEQPSPSSPKLILEHQKYFIKQPFSAIVAGNGRPRRATIGTTSTSAETTSNICTHKNKLLQIKIGEEQQQQNEIISSSPTRSDTISGSDGRQLLLLGQRRSYAQVMLKRSGAAVNDFIASGNDGNSAVEKKKKEEDDYPPISSVGTEV